MMYQLQATVVKNKSVSPSVFYLELAIPGIAALLRPGQFLHIRIGTGVDPLLRRPLSVNRVVKNNVAILYKVVGKGTRILAEKCPGEKIDVLGPLGNGFSLKPDPAILMCGGMGIAPLVFAAESLRGLLRKKTEGDIIAFVGMNTKKELLEISTLKKLGCAVHIATDDGTQGYKGFVSELLEQYLSRCKALSPQLHVYACGPLPMLRALQGIAVRYGLSGQVSVDEMMGCGVGACLGCVIKTRAPDGAAVYKRICKDGPVFDINEIFGEE
jgi:dihydroorotate dehydrogenase electron transfer subunit